MVGLGIRGFTATSNEESNGGAHGRKKWKLGFIDTTGEQSTLNPNPKPLALTIQKKYWHWRIPAVASAVTDLLTGGFEVSVDEMWAVLKIMGPVGSRLYYHTETGPNPKL